MGGWNKPSTANQPTVKKGGVKAPTKVKGIVAGLVTVCALGGLCLWMFSGGDDAVKPEQEKKPERVIKEVTPAPAPKYKEEPKVDYMKLRREKMAKMTPRERADFLYEEAKRKPLDLTPQTDRVFKTGTEQLLSHIFMTEPGDPPPPLPQISICDEAHLAEILINSVKAEEGDSEKVAQAKEMVELAKKELKAYIKEGGNFSDFVAYYRGKLMQSYAERQEAQKSVMKVVHEEPEIAADYIREVNARLDEKGIKHVKLPAPLRKKFGISE